MRAILGDRPLPRERYYQLLKEVIAGEDVSEIPQTVDQVIFGTRGTGAAVLPRAAFLIGAAQGEFPLAPSPGGVFSDAERRELIARELPLGDPLEQRAIEERYLAYSVACAPSQRLYVSWPRTADGEDKEPSELVTACWGSSRPAAFAGLAGRLFCQLQRGGFLPDGRSVQPDRQRLWGFAAAVRGRPCLPGPGGGLGAGRWPGRGAAGRLCPGPGTFWETPLPFPTQVEVYHQCPFQYFCRYGLKRQGAPSRRGGRASVRHLDALPV